MNENETYEVGDRVEFLIDKAAGTVVEVFHDETQIVAPDWLAVEFDNGNFDGMIYPRQVRRLPR